MKICQFCAEAIQDAAIVCKHCGRNLSGQPLKVRQADWISTTAKWGVGIAVIVFVVSMLNVVMCGP